MKKKGLFFLVCLTVFVILVSCGASSPVGKKYAFTQKSYSELVKALAKASGLSQSYIKENAPYDDALGEYGGSFEFLDGGKVKYTLRGYSDTSSYSIDSELKLTVEGTQIGYFDKSYKALYLEFSDFNGMFALPFYVSK